MSRHRNVRSMNYADERYDEDDEYSQSYDDNYCISPGTVAQFTFNRDKDVHLASYMGDEDNIPEEDETKVPHSNDSTLRKDLSEINQAKLNSCMDEIKNILGETTADNIIIESVLRHNFNTEVSLNELLKLSEAPKPQRQPRESRRNRSQGDDDNLFDSDDTDQTDQTSKLKSNAQFKSENNIPKPINSVTLKVNTPPQKSFVNTPPQKSIDSLSLVLSQMSTANKMNLKSSNKGVSLGSNRDNISSNNGTHIPKMIVATQNITCKGVRNDISLSQLASQNESSSSSIGGLNVNTLKLSLSQLASQNESSSSSFGGLNTNTSKLSLSQLASQNESSSVGGLNTNTSKLASQNESSIGEVNANTSKLSLSQLASQNESSSIGGLNTSTSKLASQNESSSSSGISLSKLASNHPPSLVNHNQVNVGKSLASLTNKEQVNIENSSSSNINKPKLSLAQIAADHELSLSGGLGEPVTDKQLHSSNVRSSSPVSSGPSLANLAHQNTTCNTGSGLSMLGRNSSQEKTTVQSNISNIESNNISLASLAINKQPKSKVELTDYKQNQHVDRQLSDSFFDENENIDDNFLFENNLNFCLDATMIKPSSNVGKVLSMKYKHCVSRKPVSLGYVPFRYVNQALSMKIKPEVKLHKIKPFQFNTPSPDDIIKEKQKAAFR